MTSQQVQQELDEISAMIATASTRLLQVHTNPLLEKNRRELFRMSTTLTGQAAALGRISMLVEELV